MAQDLGEVVRVQRVHDVEEVLAGRPLVLGVVVREIGVEDRVLLELGEERLDGELVVLGDLDLLDLQLLEQLLLAAEDILEEVLVDEALRRQVELEAITKIEVRNMKFCMKMENCLRDEWVDLCNLDALPACRN